MTGHIEKRSEKSWHIVLDYGRDPATGNRSRKQISFKGTEKEAHDKLTDMIREYEKGTLIDPGTTTLGEFIVEWLQSASGAGKLSMKTQKNYHSIMHSRVLPWIGAVPLAKLKAVHFQNFFNKMVKEGQMSRSKPDSEKKRKPKKVFNPETGEEIKKEPPKPKDVSNETIIYYYRVLHRIMEVAYKQELIHKNYVEMVELPLSQDEADEDYEVRILTPKHVKELEEYARDTMFYAPLFISLRTGLRRGELFGLRWGDIDMVKKKLSVRRALSSYGTFGPPKTKKSRRTFDVSDEVIRLLKQLKKEKLEKNLAAGKNSKENDLKDVLIFYQGDDETKPVNMSSYTHWMPMACEKIDIPRLTWHSLRHTHASLLLAAKIDIKVISERLGHSSIKITYDIYSHLLPNDQEDAANALEKLLNG